MESTIREQYYKMYKQLEKSAAHYWKKYRIKINVPRKVKNPTSKSLEKLKKIKEAEQKSARAKAYWIREHSFPRDIAAINALFNSANDAIMSFSINDPEYDWAEEKYTHVMRYLKEHIPMGRDETSKLRRIGIAKVIEQDLSDLHNDIETFIRESNQGFEYRGKQSAYIWTQFVMAMLRFDHIQIDIGDDDEYYFYDEGTGEIYE